MEEYTRCPNCNGEKVYNVEKGMLVCSRCGSNFPVDESGEKPIRRLYTPTYSYDSNNTEGTQYECETCGARSVVGTNGEVKRCVNCGNTTLKKITSLTNAPDSIIPFSISRHQAGEIFRKWVGSRKLAPSDLKQMAKLEKISGLYMPVWNFNFVAGWKYTAIGVKKRTDSDGHEYFIRTPVQKIKDIAYTDYTRSATSKISDDFIEGMGDYDYNKLKPYSTDYLLGFAGLQTDVDVHSVYRDFTNQITEANSKKAEEKLKDEYDYVENLLSTTRFRDVAFNYSYVPVWANHYTYKGKRYHCYINGQTGKATGNAPKSALKIGGIVLGILAAIVGAAIIVVTLL